MAGSQLDRNVSSPVRVHSETLVIRPEWRAALVVALVSLALVCVLVVRNLMAFDWNPSVFLALGADVNASRDYAIELLGNHLDLRSGLGHDGKFFFAQANDPFLTDPEVHAAVLDRPVYRSQRILFPLIGGGFGLLSPWGVVWGMLTLSVLTFGLGAFATSLVSQGMGGSAWWGLAFTLNLGVISELLVGGAGHLGLALVMASIAFLQRGRPGLSVAALSAAVLTREVLMIAVVGIALWLWRKSFRRLAMTHLAVPALAVLAWGLYVRSRIGWMTGVSEVEELGWPLVGFLEAARLWPYSLTNGAAGLAVFLLVILFIRRALRSDWLVGYAAAGFVPVVFLLTLQVWFGYFDITRAVSPVITAFLLMAFAARSPSTEHRALEERLG